LYHLVWLVDRDICGWNDGERPNPELDKVNFHLLADEDMKK
jgi:hypothetical protein